MNGVTRKLPTLREFVLEKDNDRGRNKIRMAQIRIVTPARTLGLKRGGGEGRRGREGRNL